MTNLENTRRELERIINSDPVLRNLFTAKTPSYRYFYHKENKDQYFWTTEPVKHNRKLRFVSGVYHYLKSKQQYKLTRSVYHVRRKDAKTRALKLWESAK